MGLSDVQAMILWAREQRVQISRLKDGDLEVELVDLELVGQPTVETGEGWEPKNPPADPADLYAELARQRGLNVDRSDLVRDEEERS